MSGIMFGMLLSAAMFAAAAAPKTYSDDPIHYVVTVPAGCTLRPKTKNVYSFIDCGKSYSRVAAGTGSDMPSLQKLVNTIISNWDNLKLLENEPGASLGGVTARTIYAEGTVGGQPDSILMLAATTGGRWYVLIMAAPQSEWVDDSARYFPFVKSGFHFTAKPAAKPAPKKK